MRLNIFACLAVLLVGCNSASEDARVDPAPHVLPHLNIFFEDSIPVAKRFDVVDVMREKQDVLNTSVHALVTAIQKFPVPNPGPMDVVVHNRSLLNSPYLHNVTGWVEFKGRTSHSTRTIHVTVGAYLEVPDFLHQYTHAAWYPGELYDQQPTFAFPPGAPITLWKFVADEEEIINSKMRFLAGVP